MMSGQIKVRAPGPPGKPLLGHLQAFRRDALGLLLDASRQYGDVVRFRLGPFPVHLINHPDAVEQVLQKRAQNFDKATRSARFIRAVCGNSLLSSNGPDWQRQRRMLQPFFHAQAVQGLAGMMVERTQALLRDWRLHASSGNLVDAAAEMMRLTCGIAARAFFRAEASEDVESISRAMDVILPHTFGRVQRAINLPDWVPSPGNRRFRAALQDLDRVVYSLIVRRRTLGVEDASDMLGMLLHARDDTTDQSLSSTEVRDHTITFLLAGHETTSNALAWTLYLLARHPEVQAKLAEEVRSTLPAANPSPEDVAKLVFLRQVIRESMRLYPPIWIIERRVVETDVVSGFELPAGSSVVVCPYTLHRHPAFWEHPDDFWPERFAGSAPRAYLPFGAGPRHCIGSEFAMLEAQLITALILREFRLELAPGARIDPWPGITLRLRYGLPLLLHR